MRFWRRRQDESAQDEAGLQDLLDEIAQIEAMSRSLVKDMLAGGYASAFKGAGIEFDEVREYVPGDDPRSIDWSVTARAGKPYVKRYVDEREVTVMFLLDLSRSMSHAGLGAWSARQAAARFIACLGFAAVANDDKVGLLAVGAVPELHRRPQKGRDQVLTMLRDALAAPATDGRFDLAAALRHFAAIEPRRLALFVCSDFAVGSLDGDTGEDARGVQEALAQIAARHDVTAVRFYGPEFDPEQLLTGLERVRDPEMPGRTRVVDWGREDVRAAHRAGVAAWRSSADTMLTRVGVDCLDVRIPRVADAEAIVKPIVSYFSARR